MSALRCPSCSSTSTSLPNAGVVHCFMCSTFFNVSDEPRRGRAGFSRSTRARSERQEKHNMRAVGGRRTSNSGAGSDKGDVKVPGRLREECKTTLAASYVLKLADLGKVIAAAQKDEIPILRIAFNDDLKQQFVVIESGWFQQLFNAHREKD